MYVSVLYMHVLMEWSPPPSRPREMSAKHPVPRYREVANLSKSCGREQGHDPRFDARSGTLNQDLFVKSYAFVRELCEREKKVIDGEARQTSNPVRKKKLRQLLVAMVREGVGAARWAVTGHSVLLVQEARGAGVAERSRAAAAAQEHRCRELEAKRRGQRPFFLKKSEPEAALGRIHPLTGMRTNPLPSALQRRMELMHKYQELRQCGHLHHYLAKKRKRNASRDKTMLPYQKQRTQTFPSQ